MSWLKEHKRVWRVAILATALVALMGPWAFDLTNVPSEYTCSAPHVRLDNDFCGLPLPGTWLLQFLPIWFISVSSRLVAGDGNAVQETCEFLPVLILLLLLVLPFFSTLLLILRGDRRRRQVFNVVAWGLAAGIGLLIGVSRYPRLYWMLWGVWLHIALAASALILEVLALRR
jgi:hypothetical protein